MYLSQVYLDTSKVRTARALRNRQIFHGAIERCFTGDRQRPLWRIDRENGNIKILILSHDIPDFQSFMAQFGDYNYSPMTKEYDKYIENICKPGNVLRFRMAANPIICKNGKRIPLNANRTASQPYAAMDWIRDRLENNGADMLNGILTDFKTVAAYKSGIKANKFVSAEYNGLIKITDPEKFRRALTEGFGHEKAYGCGLISVARAM